MSSREQQKAEARALREANEQAAAGADARRRRLLQLGGAAVVIAVIAAAAILITSRPAGPTADQSGTVAALFDGIPQDGLALGDPNAPQTLTEYVDLQCPICRRYVLETLPTVIDQLVRPGDLRIEMAPIAILGPDSVTGAAATVAAAQQDLAWQFADTLYRNQGPEGSGYLDDAFVQQIAAKTPGLEPADLDLKSPEVLKELDRVNSQAKAAGVNSTPSFVLGKTGQPGQAFNGDFADPQSFVNQIKEASGG